MKILIIILGIGNLFSCNKNFGRDDDKSVVKAVRKIRMADWLIGEWKSNSENGASYEAWMKQDDTTYLGTSYFMKQGDTLSSESIKLVQLADAIYYIPVIKNQNNGKPVRFKLISSDSNTLIFENQLHDFPQRIKYQALSTDSLLAEISGYRKGEFHNEKFPMQKIK